MQIALLCTGDLREESAFSYEIRRGLVELTEGTENLVQQLSPSLVRPGELLEYDLIVSNGIGREAVEECRSAMRGIRPWIVYDLGYINRWSEDNPEGYLQLGLDQLNWIPPFPVNNKRRQVNFKNPSKNPKNIVLIAPQKPGDPTHGMNLRQLNKWIEETINTIHRINPTTKIWLKNHPKNPAPYSSPKVELKDHKPLDYWLPLVGSLVTYNSTAGIQALAQGVTVYCNEVASYAHLCSRVEDFDNPRSIEILVGNDYFSKLGYSQWTKKELSTGQPFKDLMSIWENEIPLDWIDNADEPEEAISQQEYETAKAIKKEKSFFTARGIAKQQWPAKIFKNQNDINVLVDAKISGFNQQILKRV